MAIYEKPVRELMREFVSTSGISPNQVFPKSQLVQWFRANYPRIKPNTVNAQMICATTNSRTRGYYNATPINDIFFQVDSGHLRLYDAKADPTPFYGADRGAVPQEPEEAPNPSVQHGEQADSFAYESDLRNFLAANLSRIEPGLQLYEEVEGISGVEFPVGGRYVDILARDAQGSLVVIELKVSRAYDRVVGQIARYMAWIEKNLAKPGQAVRGVIVASSISDDLRLAASKIHDVSLFEYTLSVALERVS